ncbi:MAG: glutamine cyclotransferase [Flavobacteriales bacterium]|nr:glutamine cyclotransferase [Flavobacteriales bacterium]
MEHSGITKISTFIFSCVLIFGCINNKKLKKSVAKKPNIVQYRTPQFNADSAYSFIQKQVDFGPRVPNSDGHKKCGNYLVNTFQQYGAEVFLQEDVVQRYDGLDMYMKNIIASYNVDAYKRVLLCAHWDTRFMADYDTNKVNSPIIGANDGGSGVGVLLEIARQININPINIGVDIILFDVEDQGQPNSDSNIVKDSWCLGSQYWSKNPHEKNYFAEYGILLDMVGAENAQFTKEGASIYYAPKIVDKVWDIAHKIGFSSYFSLDKTAPIIDDHIYINNLIHIPTIDIVEYDINTHNKFNQHHHRHSDDIEIIDVKTLKAVGQTVLEVLYSEK